MFYGYGRNNSLGVFLFLFFIKFEIREKHELWILSNTDTYIMNYLENAEDINLPYFCISVGIAKWELSEDSNFEYSRMQRNSLGGGI